MHVYSNVWYIAHAISFGTFVVLTEDIAKHCGGEKHFQRLILNAPSASGRRGVGRKAVF